MASSDNSQDEHNVVNNKSNIIEDIQNNFLKLQILLDSDTREKVDKQVQQISEETDVEYSRPKRVTKTPEYLNDTTSSYAMAKSAETFVNNLSKVYDDLVKSEDKEQWEYAMKEEMASHQENNTWTLAQLLEGKKVVKARWVYRLKTEGDKKRYKARLVAKGYLQQLGFDYKETYAPVANIITIRTLLCVINQKNLYMCQLDVKTTFLNGQLDEEIYMEQPQRFVENSS
uniref:Copia protein n=1 Tax=Schizaphis graminum TaxID=13262 RepID=A0A2S2NYU2_SCHGA